MQKKTNPLLIALLTGTMLFGAAGIATAATSKVPVSAQHQKANLSIQTKQNVKQANPVKYAAINRTQVSAILNRLVAKGTITRTQARNIINKFAANSSITRTQMYNQLNRLVAKGTITKAQMNTIMNSLPANATFNQTPIQNKTPNDKPIAVNKVQHQAYPNQSK
jgi:polyhydroxyalkanoate synthesis regulator phasin